MRDAVLQNGDRGAELLDTRFVGCRYSSLHHCYMGHLPLGTIREGQIIGRICRLRASSNKRKEEDSEQERRLFIAAAPSVVRKDVSGFLQFIQ